MQPTGGGDLANREMHTFKEKKAYFGAARVSS